MQYTINPTQVSAVSRQTDEPESVIPENYFDPDSVTMEIHRDVPKHFMAKYERFEPVIKDHTAYITAKECTRKYFFQIVLGFTPKTEAIYFAWGSAYHKFREILERSYGVGSAAPDEYDPERGITAFTEAVNAGKNIWIKRGKDQPVGSKFDFMTLDRLIASFTVAFKHWQNEKLQGRIKVLASEQAFNVGMPDGSSVSGRADQIIRWQGQPWGRDFKTTSKDSAFFARSLDPNHQFTLYTYAESELTGEQIQGQFVETLFNAKSTKKDTKGPEVVQHITSRTSWQLERWTEDTLQMNKILTSCRENDVYPAHEVSCPFCPFHSVCQKGSESGMMSQLESYFRIRPWDNSKVGVID
jgi:hypothetical protein